MKTWRNSVCFFSCFFVIIFSVQASKSYRNSNENSWERYTHYSHVIHSKANNPFHPDKDPKVVVSKPVINTQPKDTTVCNGESAAFYVNAEGAEPLSYEWEVAQRGTGWIPISDDAVYANSSTDSLIIKVADLSMNKYKYRVIITDPYGNFRRSNAQATLYVSDGASVFASPQNDTICNGEITDITLSSDTPGTKFWVEVLYGEIYGANTVVVNDTTIQQKLINNTQQADSVVYRILPLPATTYKACDVIADTVVIWVNPTPGVQVSVFRDTICNNSYTQISLNSNNVLTSGEVTFNYTSTSDAGLTGNSSGENISSGFIIADSMHNASSYPAHPLVVRYTITPKALSVGCNDGATVIDSVSVHPTADLDFSIENVSCYSDSNGTATVHAENGVNLFSYQWNDLLNQTTSTATNLAAGSYSVTVSDNHGCANSDSIIVSEPPELTANIAYSNVTCFGEADATIRIEAQGGNEGFSYLWSNGSEDTFLNNLYEGEYIVTVTDKKGCEIYDTVNITEPELLESFIIGNNIQCFGLDNGYASLDVFGGTSPYNISWDNNPLGQGTDSIYELSPGTYHVTIIDDHKCITDNSIEITEPEQLINNVSIKNITCFGYNNGEIITDPTGGIQPYNYQWSHDDILNNDSAMNLGPGNYEVSVIDYNSCVTVSQVKLNQPDPLIADIEKTVISCHGANDGALSVNVIGGTPDYSYTWSNGYTGSVQNRMLPGSYLLTITDQLGCVIDTTLELIEPKQLIINPTIRKPSCNDIKNGYIELNIAGGRTPYTIQWDNGSTEENLYDIRSGIFEVSIQDSSLCSLDTSFKLVGAHEICIDVPNAFTPNGDSYNELWEIDMKGLYPQAEIEVFDRYGRRVFYSKGYDESQYWDGRYRGKKLPIDAYYYVINLKNGTSRISGTVTIIR